MVVTVKHLRYFKVHKDAYHHARDSGCVCQWNCASCRRERTLRMCKWPNTVSGFSLSLFFSDSLQKTNRVGCSYLLFCCFSVVSWPVSSLYYATSSTTTHFQMATNLWHSCSFAWVVWAGPAVHGKTSSSAFPFSTTIPYVYHQNNLPMSQRCGSCTSTFHLVLGCLLTT